jgi:hypothetical protein
VTSLAMNHVHRGGYFPEAQQPADKPAENPPEKPAEKPTAPSESPAPPPQVRQASA